MLMQLYSQRYDDSLFKSFILSATERFISATNAGCACPDELLTFTCTVTGTRTGATVWAGSAFNCAGGEISLRHEGFFQSGGISRDCNNEVIVARSVSVVNETCFTSELNVTVSAELNSTTVMCSLDSQTQPVGMAVILLAGKSSLIMHGFQIILPYHAYYNNCSYYDKCSDC